VAVDLRPAASGGTAVASEGGMKATLSLTGVTVNAMALIAPGAFLWTTFQSQSGQTIGGVSTASDMWVGLAFALVLAFLTAYSYSELANRYPRAGTGSSYFFAEAAFLEKEKDEHRSLARVAKFSVGWLSHLYYWIYPGIMAAFGGILFGYLYQVATNSAPPTLLLIGVVLAFTLLNTYVAFRGISGSTMTAIVINVIQLVALISFALFAIVFRVTHPSLHYANSGAASVLLGDHSFTSILGQGTIAILLLVGFESITSLGAEARNPKRDIRRGILLSLAIQGLVMYMFEYFAANMVVGSSLSGAGGYAAAGADSAPIGTMIKNMGNIVFGGSVGTLLALIVSATVLIALFGTMLACLNTGVRITYAMGRDREMPSILGLLHGRFATPHAGIWILGCISAVIGIYGVVNADNLAVTIYGSNIGTFLVYGLTNVIALIAFWSAHERGFIKHRLVPFVGAIANLGMLFGVFYLAVLAGNAKNAQGQPIVGSQTQSDALTAIIVVVVWFVAGAVWFAWNSRRLGRPARSAAGAPLPA
jgi:APA family basic amino acid/polyamine antiporter